MPPVVLYLLKVNLVISIFFLAYYCLLKTEKFFRLNRIVLLSVIGLAFLLPLLPAMESTTESRLGRGMAGFSPFNNWEHPYGNELNEVTISTPATPVNTPNTGHNTISIVKVLNILDWVYLLVVIALLLRLLFQIQQVYRIIRRSRREKVNGITYCFHALDLPVFSFFRYLVMNRDQYAPAEVEQIVAHEQAHIRQGHNFDLLLVEVVHALCWINPLLMGFKRTVKLNLEFIADKAVLDSGADPSFYQYSILRCLRPSALPLMVNLFASSKIKSRIYMMNKKNSPVRNLYKYALALPLLAGSYFIVNPLKARSMPLTHHPEASLPARQDLKEFEGYYSADFDKDTYIQIRAKGNQLILKQLWDDREIVFNQQSPLEFLDEQKGFPLKFTKNDKGKVVQLLAFNKDHWNKVNNYSEPKYIHLQPDQLKAFEGSYQMEHEGKMNYIQIEATSDGLKLRQGWDGKEILFRAISATEFRGQNGSFPLEFAKDNNGNVTQVTAFRRDVWKKMQAPSSAVIKKEIKLEPGQLKAVEGEYQMHGSNKISITAEKDGIVLKQLWDNEEVHLVPSSSTEFFSKEKGMPIVFKTDKDGVATELIAFRHDTLTKIK